MAEARASLLRALIGGPRPRPRCGSTGSSGAELRREPSRLLDALKAMGFFPGPRAVLRGGGHGRRGSRSSSGALDAWGSGDARLVLTGGGLAARGALRKLVRRAARRGRAITLYDDPPTEAEVGRAAARGGPAAASIRTRGTSSWRLAQSLPPGGLPWAPGAAVAPRARTRPNRSM